jgi:hypothetical protein
MPLANTLGVCLLLLWPRANVVPLVSAASVWGATAAQESQPGNPSPQNSSTPAPTAQKAPDQSAGPKPPACPKNSSPSSSTKTGCKQTAATKPKKDHAADKTAPPAPGDTPQKTVVPNGGTDEPPSDLSPKPGPQAPQQSEATRKLLAITEDNLKKISSRPLSQSDQDTVKQIRNYMEQAKNASDGEDPQRAYNLAVKANLLSAELAGH